MNVQSARMQQLLDTLKVMGVTAGACLLVGIVIGQQMSTRARAARYRNE